MSAEKAPKPRVGIPYRTRKEELSNKRDAYDKYVAAVHAAGAEPVEISLALSPSDLLKIAKIWTPSFFQEAPRTSNPRVTTPRGTPNPPKPTRIARKPTSPCSITPSPSTNPSWPSATVSKA